MTMASVNRAPPSVSSFISPGSPATWSVGWMSRRFTASANRR